MFAGSVTHSVSIPRSRIRAFVASIRRSYSA